MLGPQGAAVGRGASSGTCGVRAAGAPVALAHCAALSAPSVVGALTLQASNALIKG